MIAAWLNGPGNDKDSQQLLVNCETLRLLMCDTTETSNKMSLFAVTTFTDSEFSCLFCPEGRHKEHRLAGLVMEARRLIGEDINWSKCDTKLARVREIVLQILQPQQSKGMFW